MEPEEYETGDLWRTFLTLLNVAVVLLLLGLFFAMTEKTINDFLNRPQYSEEELAESSRKRATARAVERQDNWDLVENGIHVKTGLKNDENLQLIIGACTSCHSAKLITQNRATRSGWSQMIDWMQETQGLPDLGEQEPKILDYLAKHYAPEEVGRRANLDMAEIEWYILGLEDME